MTNYTTPEINTALIVSEATQFTSAKRLDVTNISWLDFTSVYGLQEEMFQNAPSIISVFANLGLTAVKTCTRTTKLEGEWLDPVVPKRDHVVVPLNTKPATIKFYEPNPGAVKSSTWRYYLSDCTLTETVELSGLFMIKKEVPYIIEPQDNEDGPLLLYIFFEEMDSGLFVN